MSSKKELVQAIEDMPDGLTAEEVVERLYQLYRVRQGLRRRSGTTPAPDSQPPAMRPIGLLRGSFTVPKTFFEPLPADLEAAFSGE